jgi:hypothetical protein
MAHRPHGLCAQRYIKVKIINRLECYINCISSYRISPICVNIHHPTRRMRSDGSARWHQCQAGQRGFPRMDGGFPVSRLPPNVDHGARNASRRPRDLRTCGLIEPLRSLLTSVAPPLRRWPWHLRAPSCSRCPPGPCTPFALRRSAIRKLPWPLCDRHRPLRWSRCRFGVQRRC